jgi:hypothetical protein
MSSAVGAPTGSNFACGWKPSASYADAPDTHDAGTPGMTWISAN